LPADRHYKEDTQSVGGGIFIGANTNVQDGCIIDSRKDHTRIGNGVTIGHLASIHSATIHDNSLIGMRSLICEGVVVHEESFVAAGAVVAANTVIPSGELWVGSPAYKLRDLTPQERQKLHYQAEEVRGRIMCTGKKTSPGFGCMCSVLLFPGLEEVFRSFFGDFAMPDDFAVDPSLLLALNST
jgi:carbonic anhydrase/acetyltransferase-like protein (isoleucine patch superfamily)